MTMEHWHSGFYCLKFCVLDRLINSSLHYQSLPFSPLFYIHLPLFVHLQLKMFKQNSKSNKKLHVIWLFTCFPNLFSLFWCHVICGWLDCIQSCSVPSTLCFQPLDLWHKFFCCQRAGEFFQLCKHRLNTDKDNIPLQPLQKSNYFLEKCAFSNILDPVMVQRSWYEVNLKKSIAHLNPAACSPVWGTGPLHSALKSDNPLLSVQHPSHPGTGPSEKDY